MTPLPGLPGSGEIIGWRLDNRRHAPTWNSGEGSFKLGGRWNSRGTRAIYASLDPSTAILEVAVHKGFKALDVVPHVLTSFRVHEPSAVHVVKAADIPNANWLHPGIPSAGQQEFGDKLLSRHAFVVIPSVVSSRSWNLLFDPAKAHGQYSLLDQSGFALDTRLNPSS